MKNQYKKLLAIWVSTSLTAFSPHFSLADGAAAGLEEIIVTATLRDTTLMETPLSISAIGEDSMEQMGAESLEDLFRSVPGMNMYSQGVGRSRIVIRGISGQSTNYPGTQMGSTTGIYIDDVPMSSSMSPEYSTAGDTFDLNRVEVLKGPQGTLFGEASQGGTIRYIYNKPNPEKFEAKVRVKYATGDDSGDSTRLDALVNIPFENGAVRLGAYTSEIGGYIDYEGTLGSKEDWNEGDTKGGRFSVLFESGNLTTQFSSIYAETETEGRNLSYSTPDDDNPYLDNGTLIVPYTAAASTFTGKAAPAADYFLEGKNLGASWSPGNDEEYQLHSLKFDLDTDVGTFTSITSYLDREVERRRPTNEESRFVIDVFTNGLTLNFAQGVFDSSGAENCFFPCNGPDLVPVFGEQDENFSNIFMAPYPDGQTVSSYQSQVTGSTERLTQEFRFTAEPTEDLFYVAGLFYKDSEDERRTDLPITYFDAERQALGQATVDSAGNEICSMACGLAVEFESQTTEIEDISIYGEVTYQVDENWSITAGARYSDLSKTIAIVGSEDFELEEDFFTPKLNISWANDTNLVYLTYSTGFSQGGVNGAPLWNIDRWEGQNAVAPGTHSPEKFAYTESVLTYEGDELTNIELGYKASFIEGRLQLTASLYQQDIEDLPVYVADFSLDPVGGVYIANAGDGSSEGGEATLTYAISENISITAFGSINETSVDGGFSGFDGSALVASGNSFIHAPEETYGFSLDASHNLYGNLRGRFYADYAHIGDRYADAANTFLLEDYSIVNMRYSIISDTGWSVALFVNNATDEVYVTDESDVSFGFGRIGRNYGRPREMGVTLNWDFL